MIKINQNLADDSRLILPINPDKAQKVDDSRLILPINPDKAPKVDDSRLIYQLTLIRLSQGKHNSIHCIIYDK